MLHRGLSVFCCKAQSSAAVVVAYSRDSTEEMLIVIPFCMIVTHEGLWDSANSWQIAAVLASVVRQLIQPFANGHSHRLRVDAICMHVLHFLAIVQQGAVALLP